MEGRRWEELDFDCLVFIFAKLGLEDLTLGVPLVCKSFHAASLDPECWKILDFQGLDFTTNSKFSTKFKHEYCVPTFSFNSYLKLAVARSRGYAIKLAIPPILGSPLLPALTLASTACPKLKELALPTLLYQDDKQIAELIGRWKELEMLEIKWKPVSFLKMIEEIGANCPNFTGLHVFGGFDGRDAQGIVKCLPGLKRLVMTASFLRGEDLVMILNGCEELQEVDVSRCSGFHADDGMMKMASARIKKFVSEGCKVDESNFSNYSAYDILFLTMICGD